MPDSNRGNRLAFGDLASLLAGLVLACIVVSIVAFSAGRQSTQAPNGIGDIEQDQPVAVVERTTDAQTRLGELGEYQSPCRDGEYNNKSDLCAQWYAARAARDAADWAYWAVICTAVSLGLSAVGLIALLVTIRQGREANEISRAMGESDLRPWIDVEIVGVSMSSSKVSFDLTVDIRLTNLGKTPALNVQSRARIVTGRGSGKIRRGDYFPGEEYTRITHNLMPNGRGDDILHPKVSVDNIGMVEIFVKEGGELKRVAGPHFVPLLEVRVEYQWGSPLRPGKTIKSFTISELHERYSEERVAVPISLGQMPLPKLTSFEHGIAEIT